MDRREFLAAAGAVGWSLAVRGNSWTGPAAVQSKRWKGMRNFVWAGPDAKADAAALKAKVAALKANGIGGVFLSGVDARKIDALKEAGLEAHIWMWTTNRGDAWIRENHPDWYMVSRTGKSCFDAPPYVDYYRWVSPVIPGVRSFLKEKVDEIASHAGVDGVHLDYVRYPDVILPKALWKDYGVDQREELPQFDFCYSAHTREAFKKKFGRDPLEMRDPAHDAEWLHFRYDSVTELVEELAAQTRRHQKAITAAVFPTPRLARKICRQDWDKWPLDFAAPMIYHSFYEEPVEWVGECVLENIQAARFPIVAGLYMPAFASPEEFRTGLRLVKKRGGAGVSLFGGVGEAFWEVFRTEMGASS